MMSLTSEHKMWSWLLSLKLHDNESGKNCSYEPWNKQQNSGQIIILQQHYILGDNSENM
jgi:hypothetical protein